MSDISVIIPVVRPKGGRKAAAAALHNCGIDRAQIEIIMDQDLDGIGCPRMVNKLARKGRGRYVCFLGDDTEAEPGWLAAALETMSALPDGWGLVGLNTDPGNPCAHWIADRRMLPLFGGEWFHEGYRHNFCDTEIMDIAQEHERWAWSAKAKIKHHHPANGETPDTHNESALNAWQQDRLLYMRRKRARVGLRLGICHPLVDPMIHNAMYMSMMAMEMPPDTKMYLPEMPHGPWGGSLADARNSLVHQALMGGCTHILMADTDQRYPVNTVTKLLSHDVDICGALVCRRYQPFDPIMMRGRIGKYVHVEDAEMDGGDLVEVDATGTGCLLIKAEVFDNLPEPWFKFDIHQGRPVGEDIYFCSEARKAGHKIYVDTSIEVGHYGYREFTRIDYKLYKKMKGL